MDSESDWSVDGLRDDADLCIEHWHAPQLAPVLVVVFDPLQQLWPTPAFGHDFLRRCKVDMLSVRKKREHFYQALTRADFEALVAPVAARYATVWSYGSSLGAYAALYFSQGFQWQVLALSPRVSVHPVHGDPAWQREVEFRHLPLGQDGPARSHARIHYDPEDDKDLRFLNEALLPVWPGAELSAWPYAGHPVTQMMSEGGFLAPYLRALLLGQAMPARNHRQRRRKSAAYLRHLAEAAHRHGHADWALGLADQSATLSPRYALAHQTLARLALERGEHERARAALQLALELAPQDPLNLSLQQRLTALTNAATTPPPDSEPPRRWWRRWLRNR